VAEPPDDEEPADDEVDGAVDGVAGLAAWVGMALVGAAEEPLDGPDGFADAAGGGAGAGVTGVATVGVNEGERSALAAGDLASPAAGFSGLESASPEVTGRLAPFVALPAVSVGRGAVSGAASVLSWAAVAASEAGASFGLPDRRSAPERELPDLVREDDMLSLSTIESTASPSGSAFRLGGAVISGGCVVRPASSTPSSLVLNRCTFVPFRRPYRQGP
jgi:hypothetical protein